MMMTEQDPKILVDFKTTLIQRIVTLAAQIEKHKLDYNVLIGQKGEAEHLLQTILQAEAEKAKAEAVANAPVEAAQEPAPPTH